MPSTLGIVASGVAAFAPSDLTGLQLWLDASDSSTITASSGSVSQWDDKSANGYNATQATGAKQPTTGTVTQNGLNVLDFDGGDELRTGFDFAAFRSNKAASVFVVMKSDRTNAASEGIVAVESSGSYDFNTGFLVERRTSFLAWTVGNGSTSLNRPAYNARRVSNSSTSWMLYSTDVSASANTVNAYINGTAQTLTTFDGSMATSNFLSGGSGNHRVNIGGRGNFTPYYLDGKIAEVVIYSAQLSSTDRQSVEDYLKTKWGI